MIKVRNFSLVLDGAWQALPVEVFYVALQIQNPAGNHDLLFKHSDAGAEIALEAGDTYEVKTPWPEQQPIKNEILVKGTAAETITGERWIYDHQTEYS